MPAHKGWKSQSRLTRRFSPESKLQRRSLTHRAKERMLGCQATSRRGRLGYDPWSTCSTTGLSEGREVGGGIRLIAYELRVCSSNAGLTSHGQYAPKVMSSVRAVDPNIRDNSMTRNGAHVVAVNLNIHFCWLELDKTSVSVVCLSQLAFSVRFMHVQGIVAL